MSDLAVLAAWAALLLWAALICFKFKKAVIFFVEVKRRADALSHLPGPPARGLLGQLSAVGSRQIHHLATQWTDLYGPVWKVRVLHFHIVGIADPVLARQVLRCKQLDKVRFLYRQLDKFLGGKNLLTGGTSAHWAAVRKGIAPAFSIANMRKAAPAIGDCAARLLSVLGTLGPDAPCNIDDLLLRESMDIIGLVGFQKRMGALAEALQQQQGACSGGAFSGGACSGSSAIQVMLQCCAEVVRRIEDPTTLLPGMLGRRTRAGNALYAQWQELVERELLQHMKQARLDPGSFADLLLHVKDPKTGLPLSDAQMLPEIAALFFAGIDTTGHTGTFFLYLVSQHPEVEAQIVAELDAAELLATPARLQPRRMGYDDIGRLPYLKNCIKEALRMYPPVGVGQVRMSRADLALAGGRLVIPRGTLVLVPHHAIQNSAHTWDRPDKFLPERWLDPAAEYPQQGRSALPAEWQARNSAADGCSLSAGAEPAEDGDAGRAKRYMPFAEGPRSCVGQALAQTTLPITLATLLSHYTFTLAEQMGGPEGVRAREQYTLVTGIKGGMYMHAIPRV